MKAIFKSSSIEKGAPGWSSRSGQEVEAQELDPTSYDKDDVGTMYKVTFADGVETAAFEDELEFVP